jgi:myo-inositol 2-dehydrogenase/D-chiro-inositol 1-dehydrogenase
MLRDRVRLGVIGTGGIATAHFRNLAKIPEAEVVALCDVVPGAAEAAAQRFGYRARIYTDFRKLIDDGGIDALYIMVPPFAHGEIELAAIEARLPFYVEKPVALTMEVARRIERALEESGVLGFVGYQWRYAPAGEKTKEVLADAVIGLLYGYYKTRPPSRPGHWLTIKEKSGGQMVEQTTHIIDMARWLVGDVKRVYARFANRLTQPNPSFTAWDVGTATIEFVNSAVGTISNCWLVPVDHVSGIELWTDKGIIEFNQRRLTIQKDREIQEVPLPPLEPDTTVHIYADRAFITAVRTGDRSGVRTPYSEAVKTLAVSLAATESAETNRVVELEEWK